MAFDYYYIREYLSSWYETSLIVLTVVLFGTSRTATAASQY